MARKPSFINEDLDEEFLNIIGQTMALPERPPQKKSALPVTLDEGIPPASPSQPPVADPAAPVSGPPSRPAPISAPAAPRPKPVKPRTENGGGTTPKSKNTAWYLGNYDFLKAESERQGFSFNGFVNLIIEDYMDRYNMNPPQFTPRQHPNNRGRKGFAAPRQHVYFYPNNYAYLMELSAVLGITVTSLVNEIVADYRDRRITRRGY